MKTAANRKPATRRRYEIVKNIEASEQMTNAALIGMRSTKYANSRGNAKNSQVRKKFHGVQVHVAQRRDAS